MFHVGQKVVCVRRNFGIKPKHSNFRDVEGSVFIIRDVLSAPQWGGLVGIRLVGIVVGDEIFSDGYLDARNFEPVVERKTDISIFTAMLNPSKVDT